MQNVCIDNCGKQKRWFNARQREAENLQNYGMNPQK